MLAIILFFPLTSQRMDRASVTKALGSYWIRAYTGFCPSKKSRFGYDWWCYSTSKPDGCNHFFLRPPCALAPLLRIGFCSRLFTGSNSIFAPLLNLCCFSIKLQKPLFGDRWTRWLATTLSSFSRFTTSLSMLIILFLVARWYGTNFWIQLKFTSLQFGTLLHQDQSLSCLSFFFFWSFSVDNPSTGWHYMVRLHVWHLFFGAAHSWPCPQYRTVQAAPTTTPDIGWLAPQMLDLILPRVVPGTIRPMEDKISSAWTCF